MQSEDAPQSEGARRERTVVARCARLAHGNETDNVERKLNIRETGKESCVQHKKEQDN